MIAAADARKVYDLLRTGDNGLLPMNQFQQYTAACACGSLGSAMPGSVPTPATSVGSMGCHQVGIHQATATFSTNVARQMSDAPAAFALYDPDYPSTDGNRHTGGIPYVLERYISLAGLNLTGTGNHMDSKGCPYGNVSGCGYNGSTAGPVGTPNTSASVYHGSIFDLFATADIDYVGAAPFAQGVLGYRTGAQLYYRLFWAPHWEGYNGTTGAGPTVYDDRVGLGSLVAFNNAGGNILGECASIQTWENASPGRPGIGGPAVGTNFLFSNGMYYDKLHSFTNTTGSGLAHPALAPDAPGSGSPLISCADPGSPGQCVTYSNVTDVFSQVGDWTYNLNQGYVDFFAASTSPASTRRTYAEPLVAVNGYDVFDKSQQDSSHGVVIYVGGHDVSGDPQGARIVLNSMLNLSSRPVSSERALAAPVVVYQQAGGVAQDELVSPTYDAVSGYGTNSAVKNFTFSQPDVSCSRTTPATCAPTASAAARPSPPASRPSPPASSGTGRAGRPDQRPGPAQPVHLRGGVPEGVPRPGRAPLRAELGPPGGLAAGEGGREDALARVAVGGRVRRRLRGRDGVLHRGLLAHLRRRGGVSAPGDRPGRAVRRAAGDAAEQLLLHRRQLHHRLAGLDGLPGRRAKGAACSTSSRAASATPPRR